METRQLKYFLAVAEELHFGRAAKRLYISQPPLSQQIKKFEDELGVKLFQRNKRSVALTAAGVSLLRDAPGILRALDRAKSNLLDAATGQGGQFVLGYIGPALETPLADIIRDFKMQYPSVRLDLREMYTNDQLKAVRSGDIDAGIVRLFRHDVSDLDCELFHRESYALVLPENHPLLKGRRLMSRSWLENSLYSFLVKAARLYDEWMRVFSEAGFVPMWFRRLHARVPPSLSVAANIGIGIVPESMDRIKPQGVVFKRLSGDFPLIEMYLIYRSTNGFPAVDNFIAEVRQNWAERKQEKN